MKIAIVGSRKYENRKKIKDFIFKLKEEKGAQTIIVSGGCKDGADKYAKKYGLHLAETTLERQQVASQVGLVLAMGPQCYKDKERYPEGPWCKVKDWVMFARYAGSRIKIDGGEMRLLNDDEVLATIDSPEDILHEF